MKTPLASAVFIATSLVLPSGAIAQSTPDITGRWIITRRDTGYEQVIEFENSADGLKVWQNSFGGPLAESVTRTGNRISFEYLLFEGTCSVPCMLEGEITSDGLFGSLRSPVPDLTDQRYQLRKINTPYCPLTGVWNYYSKSDFMYNSNSGFSDGGPPYRATVTITEDENKRVTASGFYNMSNGSGVGSRVVNSVDILMPLVVGEGQIYGGLSIDNQTISGAVHLSGQGEASIPFTMTRQTPCGGQAEVLPAPEPEPQQRERRRPSAGDVILDVLDWVF